MPRNPAPGQPVYATDKPSLSESGVTHLGRRCWRRKSGEWIANMNINDGMDLMKAAGISESTAFSLDGGLFNGKPSASLLWIEPVTEGRAAGPPAAAVPPQTALGGPSALPNGAPPRSARMAQPTRQESAGGDAACGTHERHGIASSNKTLMVGR